MKMHSEIPSKDEVHKYVIEKASGMIDDGYLVTMKHEKDTIKRGILTHVPTSLSIIHVMENSGLPLVNKYSMHLMQNLQEAIKPSPKSPAMMIAMKELIAEGRIKRIPATVLKENDENPNRISYHRAYIYVDAKCSCPHWWVRHLNEPGELHDISYKDFYSRRINTSDTINTNIRKYMTILPNSPTPDLLIDKYTTPGTTRWIASQLGIEPTSINLINISRELRNYVQRGEICQINKKTFSPTQGKGMIAVFYMKH